jgi:uncharacterized protein YpuA (DUF1002 family)
MSKKKKRDLELERRAGLVRQELEQVAKWQQKAEHDVRQLLDELWEQLGITDKNMISVINQLEEIAMQLSKRNRDTRRVLDHADLGRGASPEVAAAEARTVIDGAMRLILMNAEVRAILLNKTKTLH